MQTKSTHRKKPLPLTEQPLPPAATGLPEPVTVAGSISAEHIQFNLTASDRDGILRELVALVIGPAQKRRAQTLFRALKAREDLCPTCISEGVAIPHSRNALVGLVERPVVAYGRHRAGVEFGALDGKPVHHFFLLCAPNVREHLQLLARLSRMLNDPNFRAKLSATEQPQQLIALIRETESSLPA